MTRWLPIGAASIVAFDTVASFAAKGIDFDYGSLWPLSILLVLTFAFLAGRETGSVRAGLLTGAGVALAESTIGWAISWAVGPGALDQEDRTAVSVAATILFVVTAGCVVGAVGGWLGTHFGRQIATEQ